MTEDKEFRILICLIEVWDDDGANAIPVHSQTGAVDFQPSSKFHDRVVDRFVIYQEGGSFPFFFGQEDGLDMV